MPRMPRCLSVTVAVVAMLLVCACSTTKYVPRGSYLLDKVKVRIVPDSTGRRPSDVSASDLHSYLRQIPNYEVFGFLKLQLHTYSLAGRDSSAFNRWLRRIGQPPVILDSAQTAASARQLRLAMINRGYMDATVTVDSVLKPHKKKASLTFNVNPGSPRYIASINYDVPDSTIRRLVLLDSAQVEIQPGAAFNRDNLEQMRVFITDHLQRRGYYSFSKEYITFVADTAAGDMGVNLTLQVHPPFRPGTTQADTTALHRQFAIRNVVFVTDYTPGRTVSDIVSNADYIDADGGYITVYGKDRYIKPSLLIEKCFIIPGRTYNAASVDRTYEYFARLGIIRSTTIEFARVGDDAPDGEPLLDAYVLLQRNKKQSVSLELEGTNSEGDLGFGVGLTYRHRNLAHASQLLTVKLRSSYESLSGNLEGLVNDRYTEQAAQVDLQFPRFIFPFLNRDFKHRVRSTSELALSFNYQERPEYTRIIAGAAWKYRWNNRPGTRRSTWDFVDINYVRLPKSTIDFINQIAPDNPLLRYSYEDHFIMRMGFSYNWTNRRTPNLNGGDILKRARLQPSVYNIRASVETAGNLLRGISAITGQHRNDGVYKIFGIQYAQYAKAEADFTYLRNFTPRHSLALHGGIGVGVPYGNSSAIPFEKRFYAGGANGVRGWSVRTLGPGTYAGNGSVDDFMNQCGDISLIMSAEYRAKLFWLLQGAIFVDAGNIWTIRNYPNQPGGLWHPGTFWREIAMAYGVGLRMDFTYFIFRIDLGLKAHNPAQDREPWPIIHPNWHRDATFHFAVGYPF